VGKALQKHEDGTGDKKTPPQLKSSLGREERGANRFNCSPPEKKRRKGPIQEGDCRLLSLGSKKITGDGGPR